MDMIPDIEGMKFLIIGYHVGFNILPCIVFFLIIDIGMLIGYNSGSVHITIENNIINEGIE